MAQQWQQKLMVEHSNQLSEWQKLTGSERDGLMTSNRWFDNNNEAVWQLWGGSMMMTATMRMSTATMRWLHNDKTAQWLWGSLMMTIKWLDDDDEVASWGQQWGGFTMMRWIDDLCATIKINLPLFLMKARMIVHLNSLFLVCPNWPSLHHYQQ